MIQLLQPGGLVASVIALLFGLLIFAFPRLLNYLVAAYLVIIGLIGILAAFGAR